MSKLIKLNGRKYEIKTYNNKRVLTTTQIEEILFGEYKHTGKIPARISTRINRGDLVENEDFVIVPPEVFGLYSGSNINNGRSAYLIFESGFKKLETSSSRATDDQYWFNATIESYYNDRPLPKKIVEGPKAEPVKLTEPEKAYMDNDILATTLANFMVAYKAENDRFLKELRDIYGTKTVKSEPAKITFTTQVPFEEYKKRVCDKARDIYHKNKVRYKDVNAILSNCYATLRETHGVVWEQGKKEFTDQFGRTPMSTLELAWYIEEKWPNHRNLVYNRLCDME